MNCPGCNAPLKSGSTTCIECGAALAATPPRDRAPADWLKLMLGIAKLEDAAVMEVARDPNATVVAVAAIAAAGAAPAVGSFAIFGLLIGPVFLLIGSAISIAVVSLIARALGGKGELQELYRTQGLTYGLHVVGVIPFLGPLLTAVVHFAQVAFMVNNVRVVHKLPLPHSIVAVILPTVILAALAAVAMFMFGAAFFALLFASGAAR